MNDKTVFISHPTLQTTDTNIRHTDTLVTTGVTKTQYEANQEGDERAEDHGRCANVPFCRLKLRRPQHYDQRSEIPFVTARRNRKMKNTASTLKTTGIVGEDMSVEVPSGSRIDSTTLDIIKSGMKASV